MAEINEELKDLIEKNVVALASIDESGKPHCIVVAYPKIVSKNQVVITDNFMKETVQNILKNNNISLIVWNTDWDDIEDCYGYEVRGVVEYFNSGKWHDFVKNMDKNKGLPAKGAIVVTVNKIKKLV
jgi:predicted pyridoxine 5'-phosphate oxidase superfamily flavin-nucleotide-binding protein